MKLGDCFSKVVFLAYAFLSLFCHQAVASQSDSLDKPSRSATGVIEDEKSSNVAEQCPGNRQMIETTKLSLDSIRTTLIRLEETIIFALIERAQYRRNLEAYRKESNLGIPIGANPLAGQSEDLSLLEYYLVGTELLNRFAKRYENEEENAFFAARLPCDKTSTRASVPGKFLSTVGGAADVNFNHILLRKYINDIVPAIIATPGEDENLAVSVSSDVVVLQALSKRIHYGKFVAEAKYLADPGGYQKLVDANDTDGVMELLTNKAVERKVLERVKLKAAAYGTGPHGGDNPDCKLDPEQIESIFRDIVIPITKDIEVDYLFRRCGYHSDTSKIC